MRVDGCPSKVGASVIARHFHSILCARRSKHPLVAGMTDSFEKPFALDWIRDIRAQIFFRERLPGKGWRLKRKGLRRRRFFSGHVRFRYRSLLNGPKRLAGFPFEDPNEAFFVDLDHDV